MTYKVTNQWSGGFQADVTLTNTGTAALDGWQLGWTFADGQKVTQMWNATPTQDGAKVKAASISWNGKVAPGGSVGFGFTGTLTGGNSAPAAFALGDEACTTG